MIKRITEVGIAVRDLAIAGIRLHEVLGAQKGTLLRADEYNMLVQMWRTGNIEFELMQPLQQGGIIEKFLQKRGEGLHHIAFQVENITETLKWIKKQNVKMINEEPVSVSQLKAAFLHPESFDGVLVELIEGVPKHVGNQMLPPELQTKVPEKGIGIEGILEVGIIVNDLDAAGDFYSSVFMLKPSEIVNLGHASHRMRTLRAGNVDLKLMEITGEPDSHSILLEKREVGLNHVTLKVQDIETALAYLKRREINLVWDPLLASYDSGALLIHPDDLNGIPIILKGSI